MKTLIVVVVVSLFLAGCVTTPFQRYGDEMKRVATLYGRGRISEPQKAKVIEYGESFWLSYNQSLDDLETFLGYTHTLPGGE